MIYTDSELMELHYRLRNDGLDTTGDFFLYLVWVASCYLSFINYTEKDHASLWIVHCRYPILISD